MFREPIRFTTHDEISAWLEDNHDAEAVENMLLLEGLEKAFRGTIDTARWSSKTGDVQGLCAVYSISAIMNVLIEDDGMDEEEATDYFMFNVECLYVGEQNPILLNDLEV